MNKVHSLISNMLFKEKYTKSTLAIFSQKVQRKKTPGRTRKKRVYPNERMKLSRHDTWKALHPGEGLIGDSSDRHVQDKIILLVGEIIRGGLSEYGTEWLDYRIGRYWCSVANAEPTYIKRKIDSGVIPSRPKNKRK